jgi:hypothetical protein
MMACNTSKNKESVITADTTRQTTIIKDTTVYAIEPLDSLSIGLNNNIEELFEDFLYCRDNADNDFSCKYHIAKAICEYYGINDFKLKDGNYMDYEHIAPFVMQSQNWFKIGEAKQQDALNRAQQQVENGFATLAFSPEKYGHIVLILPGKLKPAPSWNNLKCPDVASFFMTKNLEPFVNKSMAYAWSKPDGILIYSRKK